MTMQLDHEQLHRLLEALGDSDIQEFRLEGDDFRLEGASQSARPDRCGPGSNGPSDGRCCGTGGPG